MNKKLINTPYKLRNNRDTKNYISLSNTTNSNPTTSTAGGDSWLEDYFTNNTEEQLIELNSELVISGSTYTGSFSYTGSTYTGLTNTSTIILGDLYVDGNVKASGEVVAYIAEEIESSIFDGLTVTNPLSKSGTTISLGYNPTYFELDGNNRLSIVSGSIGGGGITGVTWDEITDKPTEFTPATHSIASHTDISNYFTGYIANQATTASYIDYSNVSNTPTIPSVYDGTITISAGSGLSGGASFTTNQSFNETITLNHSDTSTQGSVNNSGNTVIQDISLDTYGHITDINSTTINSVNYATSASYATNSTNATYADSAKTPFEIKNSSGTTIWSITTDGSSLYFNNGVNRCKLDASGNLTAYGDVIAYG